MEIEDAIQIDSAEEFERWLVAHGATERDLWIALYTKASGKQVVTFDILLEIGLCHGWVDTKTKKIDEERYGIRFVPRKPGSNWSSRNREIVKRLLADQRMSPAGIATLPADL